MKIVLVIAASALIMFAQSTRTVSLSWTASTSSGVTGYNVSRGASTSGPFTQLNSALITGTTYADTTAVIGQTYTYQVVAMAVPCTPTTPVTTVCGQSVPASATTTVPQQPNVTVTISIVVN
jgi:hypothetical protein